MKFKKILSAFLAAAISVSSISVVSSAQAPQTVEETIEMYQTSGDSFVKGDLKYTELDDGTLAVRCALNETDRAKITTLDIPAVVNGKRVAVIDEEAFFRCKNLTTVTIPSSITAIYGSAFYNCKSLLSVTIPNGVTSIGRYAFCSCSSLTSVTIPNSVKGIGGRAFQYCQKLESVVLPNSIKAIGSETFNNCASLKSVVIPSSVTKIYEGAFSNCTNLSSITVSSDNKDYCVVDGVLFNKGKTELIQYPAGKTNKSYAIPSSTTRVEQKAFSGCENLTSVTIPNSVKSIWDYAFSGSTNLKHVVIPNSISNISVGVFEGCTGLVSVTIPESVTLINDEAFYNCTSLTNINVASDNLFFCSEGGVLFNKSKTKLIQYPAGKTNKSYTIPNGVTSIDRWAFYRCKNLVFVAIPNSITTIGSSTFSDCTNLTSLMLTNSVISIDKIAFTNGTRLKNIYYTGTEDQWNTVLIGTNNIGLESATIHCNYVPKIEGFKGSSNNNSVKLVWSKYGLAAYYKVFIWKNNKWTELIKTKDNNILNYTAAKLEADTSYKLRAAAYNESNILIAHSDITVKTKGKIANLKAATTNSSIKLTWNKNTSASYYKVWILKNGKWSQLTQTKNNSVLNYTASGLTANTSYKFRVTAYNANNKAIAYSDISTKTLANVANLKTVSAKNSIKLTWSRNASAKYYKVFVWNNGKCQLLKQINNSTAPNYTTAGLKLNTAYKYRVTAYNTSNKAIAFSDISTRTLANISNLKATPTKNSVKLTWSRNASAKYYKVFVWNNGKCQLLKQINNSSAPNYTAAGLKLNTAYKYRVTAYNASNKAIAFSDISTRTLANISNLKATPAKNYVKLTWSKNTSAKYYKVFVWKNGKWTQLTQTKSNSVLTYTASKLTANTSYKFRVTAYNASNKAIAFSDVTARTLK